MLIKKSTATDKYETACYVQEAAVSSNLKPGEYTVEKSAAGIPFVIFRSPLWSFGHQNRMHRRYDIDNAKDVINNDERIQDLKSRNMWRGEWNHPNPDVKGQQLTDIRMTIPEPMRTSHFINDDEFIGDLYKATITTHPGTECGKAVASEIIDVGGIPAFSVRLLGSMLPRASINEPNMRVHKVITFDMVDFPSHQEAVAEISKKSKVTQEGSVIFLKELAKYCVEQDRDGLGVVCESFQISMDEIEGINDGRIVIAEKDSSILQIPLRGDVRREALSILRGGR